MCLQDAEVAGLQLEESDSMGCDDDRFPWFFCSTLQIVFYSFIFISESKPNSFNFELRKTIGSFHPKLQFNFF